ncbi:malto-oligosyltrehalose synthase [Streptomyces sp. PKU-EA00015]|uniref:malto-oligosyltrehalose synthase n=1 Tax=Streptomyces sp. PKU-EA00015 TaxID=2748326 RepID=UPI0015A06D62|nr:malto-oligosyltrehalose synthase [Streptomyces sp. PKU-EA00015]NWF29289.1 malto-oligosyltrehalose synthase [Streptomyces sp. PKU-EA00015]
MTPTATYRLQLQPDFPFAAAEAAVPYLADLGVSHLHLSPVLEAVPGSTHGYDVVDHGRVRAELGGEEGLRRLSHTAREHGLGLVVDIVPNHMAAVPRYNRALWEVLREGPRSPFARWFDIDWAAGDGKVLLPVLPGRIGGELAQLRVEGEVLHHGEQRFPLRASTAHLPLPELLDAQWYRLAWWRLARTELNYRRFFTVSDLIGVRVEDPEVFDATHAKILELVRDGVVDGLRVDHPDGVADPEGYLRRLDEATGGWGPLPRPPGRRGSWIVVEKILTGDERLPAGWPVAGTTGYDALRRIDGLFTDPAGVRQLVGVYRDFTDVDDSLGGRWEATARRAAYEVVTHELAAETATLVRLAERICAEDTRLRDHAPWALRAAVRELLVRVPVYRPYRVDAESALPEDAARAARDTFAVPEEAAAVDVVRDLALGRLGDGPDHVRFRARFAQTASALRAKSVEDTAFYRYAPLISANEVGGDPGNPAVEPAAFHAFCARLARDWAGTGTVLTTHDTKRSADVRARIAVLSECPERWARFLERITEEAESPSGGGGAPDAQLAWVAWQTAVGFGIPDADRLEAALLKAVREAGVHTSWTESDPAYEKAVSAFVGSGPAGSPQHSVARFVRQLAPYVRANVLGAALLHLTMPGVPDVYQGSEREFLALVDPDNRAPARFGPPLSEPLTVGAGAGSATGPEGRLSAEKEALTATVLRLRRARPDLFGARAAYEALAASGPAAGHCVAFRRGEEVVTAVTRLSMRLEGEGGWRGTALTLPPGRWTDLLGGEREFTGEVPVPVADLFAARPVALLSRADGPAASWETG